MEEGDRVLIGFLAVVVAVAGLIISNIYSSHQIESARLACVADGGGALCNPPPHARRCD